MNFLLNIIKGILIGSGAILPGISSGVMCVIFGIYEDLLNRLLNFFKNPVDNFKFFLPYIIGGIIGILLVGKLLLYLFNTFHTATCFAFIGLILGCVPSVIKQCGNNIENKFLHWLCLILTLTFSIYLVALEWSYNDITTQITSPLSLGLSGLFMSAGVVVPGISSSAILMIMGIYETYLSAIANINLEILFPLGIGLMIGSYIFLKLISMLFSHFKTYTYYAISGFTLGSVFVIFPGFAFDIETLIGVALCVICFAVSYSLAKIEK